MAIAQLVNFNRKSIYILTLVEMKKKQEIFFTMMRQKTIRGVIPKQDTILSNECHVLGS